MRSYLFLAENQHKIGPNERQKLHFCNLLSQKTPRLPLPKVAVAAVKAPQTCQVVAALRCSKPEHGINQTCWAGQALPIKLLNTIYITMGYVIRRAFYAVMLVKVLPAIRTLCFDQAHHYNGFNSAVEISLRASKPWRQHAWISRSGGFLRRRVNRPYAQLAGLKANTSMNLA